MEKEEPTIFVDTKEDVKCATDGWVLTTDKKCMPKGSNYCGNSRYCNAGRACCDKGSKCC